MNKPNNNKQSRERQRKRLVKINWNQILNKHFSVVCDIFMHLGCRETTVPAKLKLPQIIHNKKVDNKIIIFVYNILLSAPPKAKQSQFNK